MVKELSLVPLLTNKEPALGVLFVASIIGVTTENAVVSLWTYREREHNFVNIMSPLTYETNPFGAFTLLSRIRADMEGLAAVADYIYGKKEVRSQAHRFSISLYRYNDKAGVFKPIGSFVTRNRYDDRNIDYIFPYGR